MESNRIWHEPEVVIYGVLVTPKVCFSGHAYDLVNRRWYHININSDIYDEEWTADTIGNHISTYYQTWGTQIPFDVINKT